MARRWSSGTASANSGKTIDIDRIRQAEAYLWEPKKKMRCGFVARRFNVVRPLKRQWARFEEEGVSLIVAIKAVLKVSSLPLGKAKHLVATHPAWRAEVAANEPLQDAAEGIAKRRV